MKGRLSFTRGTRGTVIVNLEGVRVGKICPAVDHETKKTGYKYFQEGDRKGGDLFETFEAAKSSLFKR